MKFDINHVPKELRDLFAPGELEKAWQETEANPVRQRFKYLNTRYHGNTATPEERKEYEEMTWWMRVDDPKRLMPDTMPNPWELPRPEGK